MVLLVCAVVQLRVLTAGFIWPRLGRYWEVRAYPAWQRSALLSEGQPFMDYVTFLRQEVPESGRLVLPPHRFVSEGGPYTYPSFMQYYLFPREILNCGEPVEDCVRGLSGGRSYILRVGSFPPPSIAAETKTYIPFNDMLGVYVPR
jgi:hypothetical protein